MKVFCLALPIVLICMSCAVARRAPPKLLTDDQVHGSVANPPGVFTGRYLGCFADRPKRDLAGPTSLQTDPMACVQWCGDMAQDFAGMQAGKRCFCGDSHGRYGTSKVCKPCANDLNQNCGGPWANAVWQVGPRMTRFPLPPDALPPRDRKSVV